MNIPRRAFLAAAASLAACRGWMTGKDVCSCNEVVDADSVTVSIEAGDYVARR